MKSTWKTLKFVRHWQLSKNESMRSKMSPIGSKRLPMSGTKRKLSLSTHITLTVSTLILFRICGDWGFETKLR